jgi:cell fate regulator YaaT (PSP1 superfamily)
VEILFKGNRRSLFVNTQNMSLAQGAYVIVEADKGEDLGRVSQTGDLLKDRIRGKKKSVVRLAGENELARWRLLRPKEDEAYKDFQRRVIRRKMAMKPVDVEYQLDGKKICFYFTADHRVDFRELVRELAAIYRTRIELRQIGVRDEAKRLGGLGVCGRELCCATFLSDFAPITSQMARDQNLSLNPSKLSGICGRLKCCLRFEHEFYREAHERFPKLGAHFEINGHAGTVMKIDFLRDAVTLRSEENEDWTVSLSDSRAKQNLRPRTKNLATV